MQKEVSVLGHFGKGVDLFNGQTVKTKIVTAEIQKQIGQDKVLKIDTHGGWKTLFKAPIQVFYALKKSRNIIMFPAHNGIRVYAPLLVVQRCLLKKRKLYYVVIGGWLPEFLMKRRYLASILKKFDGIYVETNSMKSSLEEQGFSNIYVMANCKNLKILTEEELVYSSTAPYKLCTFSRVMREKGVEEAIQAVCKVNEELNYQAFTLDIYGQVDKEQLEWFKKLQDSFPEYINYGGIVPFDYSVEVLKEYYALLFPTYYEGEGFAGTLIDAFAAGVPVIASDWKYNSELVKSYKNGLLIKGHGVTELSYALRYILENAEEWNKMKYECLKEAESYIPENALKILIDKIKDL